MFRKKVLFIVFISLFVFSLPAMASPTKWRVVTHQPTGTVRYDLVAEFCAKFVDRKSVV